jgi:hypothetical protein
MKKEIVFLSFLVFSVILTAIVSAKAISNNESFKVNIKQNSSEGEAYGQAFGWGGNQIQAIGVDVEPHTSYTLLYYNEKIVKSTWRSTRNSTQGSGYTNKWGSTYSSKRYPVVYCLGQGVSGESGLLSFTNTYKYSNMLKNRINERLVLVPSSDVDCKRNKMFNWIENEYLFADKTI